MTAAAAKLLMAMVILARTSAFIFSKFMLEELTPFQSLAWRFLAAFVLLALFSRKHLGKALRSDARLWKKSALLGLSLFGVMACEMYSLQTASVQTVAFLENMAVAIVPLLLALWNRKLPSPKILTGCGFIILGVAALTCGRTGFSIQGGEGWALLDAFFYALYIIATGAFAKDSDAYSLGVLQMGFIGLLSLASAFFQGGMAVPVQPLPVLSLLFEILVCSCFGFVFQPVAQRYLSSEEAGLYCALTPLFGAILGFAVFGETFDSTGILGAVYILTGMVWVNWPKHSFLHSALNASHGQTRYLKQSPAPAAGATARW